MNTQDDRRNTDQMILSELKDLKTSQANIYSKIDNLQKAFYDYRFDFNKELHEELRKRDITISEIKSDLRIEMKMRSLFFGLLGSLPAWAFNFWKLKK